MRFGKFVIFLKSFQCGHTTIKRFKTTSNESIDILMKQLELSRDESAKLIKKNKLIQDSDQLLRTLTTLKLLGYAKEEILKYSGMLKLTSRAIHEYYLVFQEAGFSDLGLLVLSKKLANKKISTLKVMNFIPTHVNVPETLVMHLDPKPFQSFIDDFTEEHIFSQIHVLIVKRYLQWRLEATSDEIETYFRIYSSSLKYKSLQTLCENIQIALDLGFTPRKLLSFGYLLHNDPSYPKTVLEKIPTLAGEDMRVMMRRYPKLVTVPLKQYTKIYEILKRENIPDSTIRKQMNIFTLSPETIKSRFSEISDIPEMNVLRQSPRILRLIIHYNRARSRLSFMHQLQLKCATMCLLEHDNEHYFNNYVRNTKDVNVLQDVLTLLRHLLKSNTPEIEINLKRHPYYRHVPLVNIERTCRHIQKSFSNNTIIKVLPIVLYPSDKIENALKQISSMMDLPTTRLTDTKKLNLALYLIEKDYHFTGDGVWENSESVSN